MPSGPSKQELEMYWKDSRQYFDELAKYYKESDKAYYDEYIAPFYSNPFISVSESGGKSSGGSAKLVVVMAVFIFLLAAGGAAVFLFMDEFSGNDDKKDEPVKKEKKTESINKEETKTPGDETEPGDETSLSSDDHFIIGSKKIGEKDYDKAEYHLKQVKRGTQYYEQAKQLLENMKYLRKYNK